LPPENPRRRFRDLIRSVGARSTANKKFDTSGKSPAYLHHRKNFLSPRREIGRGLFQSDGSRIRSAFILRCQRIDAKRVSSALPSEPLLD
jgi:hypothetical protein